MKNPPLKARQPAAGKNVERITLSLDGEDKRALEKLANEKRVSIAWVIRDAVSRYLTEEKENSDRKTEG